MVSTRRLVVYHDGSCPLCRREIAFYQRRLPADSVCWQDVSRAETGWVAPDLTTREAMARFHVRGADGRLYSGARAFAQLWRHVPGWRWLGRFAASPPLVWLLELAYRAFLPLRPRLQRVLGGRARASCRPCEDEPRR